MEIERCFCIKMVCFRMIKWVYGKPRVLLTYVLLMCVLMLISLSSMIKVEPNIPEETIIRDLPNLPDSMKPDEYYFISTFTRSFADKQFASRTPQVLFSTLPHLLVHRACYAHQYPHCKFSSCRKVSHILLEIIHFLIQQIGLKDKLCRKRGDIQKLRALGRLPSNLGASGGIIQN